MDDAFNDDFEKGLVIAQDLKNLILEGHLRQNIGYYFMIEDSLNEAENNYLKVQEIGKKIITLD